MADHSFLKSSFPVLIIPYCHVDTQALIEALPARLDREIASADSEIRCPDPNETKQPDCQIASADSEVRCPDPNEQPGFMHSLLDYKHGKSSLPADQMLTANGDITYSDSGDPHVNLFQQLQDSLAADGIVDLLNTAWASDAELTLKVIWNARSIHLGKSSRSIFYRAMGWLAQSHPRTFLDNLHWLVRPVIQKKVPKVKPDGEATPGVDAPADSTNVNDDSDFEMVDADDEADARAAKQPKIGEPHAELDIKYGLAHGYWKDLLNLLALAACDELKPEGNISNVLNSGSELSKRDWTKGRRKDRVETQYGRVTAKLNDDVFYKALHMTVARLFADQLAADVRRLQSGSNGDLKRISLAAKWAPSNKGMHDERTFVASTIAELLHPADTLGLSGAERDTYLRHARCAYQSKTLSPLRKHLDIVERKLTAKAFDHIKYGRLPSLAMKRYTKVFISRDEEHFEQYLEDVAVGKAKISGATLLPSTLVAEARSRLTVHHGWDYSADAAAKDLVGLVADGQWNTLVQRIKDSGSMVSAIAVCDVSGSMMSPRFADGSTPLDAAIGLSLVLAEVCKPPFGGAFITFHSSPEVVQIEDDLTRKRTFYEKVRHIENSEWGGSTDLEAVFLKCILPMAHKHKLKQEDMVKRVFVFSDMHFDQATFLSYDKTWSSTFDRIKLAYQKSGYGLPELVFWNLASAAQGSRAGMRPMPVQAEQPGTAMLSGYSQAMMKVFMEGGGFDEMQPDQFEADTVVIDSEGNEVKTGVKQMTPLGTVEKAVGHNAYRMLQVVD